MRVWLAASIVCIGVVSTGIAPAAPRTSVDDMYRAASQLYQERDYRRSLEVIDEALAIAPRNRDLMFLRVAVLVDLGDRTRAIAACQAFLKTAKGRNRLEVQGLLATLLKAQVTSIAIEIANGPAIVQLDHARKPACAAAPSCTQAVSPGRHHIVIERPGFERWTGNVTVARGATEPLVITLIEKPSLVTVRSVPAAAITLDRVAYRGPINVAAGSHQVAVSLAGHRAEQREIVAREGTPIELDVALTPLVAVRIAPASATLSIAGAPVAIEAGGIEVPPGPQELTVRAPGFVERTVPIRAERPADYEIVVELARPPPPRSIFTLRRKIALASLGAGLAAGATGVTLGIQSRQRDDDARGLCPSPAMPCSKAPAANELNRQARQRASQANIAYGAAGAAAVAAVILWFTGGRESEVTIAPQAGAGAGLSVAGSF